MRRLANLCAAALLAGTASADIDLLLTRGPDDGSVPGMKGPDTFNPAEKNFLPNYVPWSGNPQHSPFVQPLGRSEIYFLWAEATLRGSEVFYQIYGMDFRGSRTTGGAVLEDGLFYRHNKPAPSAYKRWDSSNKLPLPGFVGAVTARGVEAPANNSDIATDYDHRTYALLGAVRVSGDTEGSFQLGFGPWSIALRVTDPFGDPNELDYNGRDRRYVYVTIQGKNAYDRPYDAVILIRLGDTNCDRTVNFGDVNPFVLALTDPDEYRKQFPNCNILVADCNEDGEIDFGDINPFVELLSR